MLILGIIDIPFWILTFLSLFIGFYVYTERKHSVFKKCGLKGPKPAPFIGSLSLIKRKGVRMCEYDGTIEYGKCFGFFVGNFPEILLTDTEIIKEIFVKRFSSYPNRSQAAHVSKFWETTLLFTTNQHNWKFLRSTLAPSFSSGKLKKLNPLVLSCINKMINKISEQMKTNKVLEMMEILQSLTMDVIFQSALGVQMQHNGEFTKQVSALLNLSIEKNPILTLLLLIPDINRLYKFFDIDYNNTKTIKLIQASMQKIVKERVQHPSSNRQDLLQLMIDSLDDSKEEGIDQDTRSMTEEEIVANSMMLLLAGYHTTASVLTFSIYFLATEPECQEKLCREIDTDIGKAEPTYEKVNDLKYLEMFVSEVMRLYPPLTRTNRQNYEDVKIGNYTFPKGVAVTVPIFTLHRMEEYWQNPLKFDPERFSPENKLNLNPYAYMPFGAGPRNCLGMRFAQMEVKVTLVKLMQNFKFGPSESLQVPPELEKDMLCKPTGGVPVKVEMRA